MKNFTFNFTFTWIEIAIAAIVGWISYFIGGLDGLIYALVIFVCIDYITGVIYAVINKKLSSETGFRGILKKILIFLLVGIGHIIDIYILDEHGGDIIRTAVAVFYLANEGVSILENVSAIGLPVPQKLKDVLSQLNDDEKNQSKK